jgi:hypothetical protein
MSDDTAALGKQHRGVSKFLSKKDRWREKLSNNLNLAGSSSELAKEKSPKAENFTLSDDVADFLKPSTSKIRPISPKAPRIGIDIAAAQKWASNAASSAGGNGLPTPSSMQKKDYPRRALKLAVQFSNAAPEVIGEGGDESEEAVVEISRRLEQSGQRRPRPVLHPRNVTAPAQPANYDRQRQEYHELRASNSISHARPQMEDIDLEKPPPLNSHTRNNSFPTDEPDFVPKPIQRTQTRFGDLDNSDDNDNNNSKNKNENVRLSLDSGSIYSTHSSIEPAQETHKPIANRETYQLPALKSVLDSSPLELRTTRLEDLHFGGKRNSLSSPILQEKIHKMCAEEGYTLHSAVEQDPFLDNFGTSNRQSSSTIGSIKQEPGEVTPRKSNAQGQPSSSNNQPLVQIGSSLQVQQPQQSQMSTPSPFQNEPTPDVQPRHTVPSRKAVVPPPINSQLRPTPNESGPGSSPRISPSLNITIPGRADYFQASSLGPPSRVSDTSYTPRDSAGSSAANTANTPHTASSIRTSANVTPGAALGQLALDDFADRCSHMGGIFRLQAEFDRPIYDFTASQWLRGATWWFLRGRVGIESLMQSRPRSHDGRFDAIHGQELLSQPHVDLAKTWWILTEVVSNHPSLRPSNAPDYSERSLEARSGGDEASAELFESCDYLTVNLKGLLASMKRNGVMPPTHALIQGQDQTIWVKYPDLSPALHPILSGVSGRSLTEGGNVQSFSPLAVMAVADTRLDFSYNRCFTTALLGTDDPDIERIPLPAIVSVMRERNDWHPKVTICTQKELVTICVQGDRKHGPSWQDVKWSETNRSLLVSLPHGYSLTVQLNEPDFRQLFNLYNHTFRVQSSLLPLANERVVYETSLTDFQYKDSRQPAAFPPERVKRCRIRIFAKTESRFEGTGEQKIYRGFRILAVTSPKNRILGSASHDVGMRYPTLIAGVQDPTNPSLPALTLYVQEDRRQCSLLMIFSNEQDSRMLLDTLNSFVLLQGESQVAAVRLKSFNIESSDQAEAFSASPRNALARMRWHEILTLSKDPETPGSGFDNIVPNESLRVIAQAAEGTVTDRVDGGPGELMLRLSPDGNQDLTILRAAQGTMSITIDPSRAPQQLPAELADIQRTVFMLPTIRTLSFYSIEDLHQFQASVTSFNVVYDGLAQAFTIARRRPVTALSRHKKLEAGITRLQIVSHERQRIIQLLAFFDDMPQVEALNFQLKGVDQFERHEDKHSKGRYGVKLVDAKFTLPIKEKGDKDEKGSRSATPDEAGGRAGNLEKRFVCLDALEPPAENDDIVVGFESEQGMYSLLQSQLCSY